MRLFDMFFFRLANAAGNRPLTLVLNCLLGHTICFLLYLVIKHRQKNTTKTTMTIIAVLPALRQQAGKPQTAVHRDAAAHAGAAPEKV